jgi:hypothetical protein
VLATVRTRRAGARPEDDVARWRALVELFDEVGIELLDWFVLAAGAPVVSLRTFTGMPSQWHGT